MTKFYDYLDYETDVEVYQTIRERICARLKELDMTQADLARCANISQPKVNAYLRGNKDMRGASLDRILTCLGGKWSVNGLEWVT